MKNLLIVILLLIIYAFSLNYCSADSKVLINEFMVEPTQSVEVFNVGEETVDLSGWYIDDSGGSTYYKIPQQSVIYPNSCLVFTSNFNLNTASSDTLRLFDSLAPPTSQSAQLIDSYSYAKSPGKNISFFREIDGESVWITGAESLGSYNLSGQSCVVLPTPTSSPTNTPFPTVTATPEPSPTIIPSSTPTATPIPSSPPTPTETPVTYDNIFISEAMVYPETGEKEWVEIYNDNEFDVNLIKWYLDDIEDAGSTPKLFSLLIEAKGYKTIELASSIFNNDSDQVRLLDFEKNQKDSFEYSDGERGKTFGRTSLESDEFCLQEPSQSQQNNQCLNFTPSPTTTSKSSLSSTKPSSTPKPPSPTKPLTKTSIKRNQPTAVTAQKKYQQNLYNSNVLGTQTVSQPISRNQHLVRSLSFASFSYSLLTIVSIFLKMKKLA